MSTRTKKRSASFVEDSDDSSTTRPTAPKKTKGTAAASSNGASGKDDEGNPFWELSQKRRVVVSQFKNMSFIGIREYYEKDGKTLPGKKGISLSFEQYNSLLKVIPQINEALRELGHDVGDSTVTASNGSGTLTKAKREKPSKANIEATSEEDN